MTVNLIIGLSVVIIIFLTIVFFYLANAYNIFIKRRPPFISSALKVYKLVEDDINKNRDINFLELGCGKGKGLKFLSKNKNWKLLGYEVYIFPYLWAKVSTYNEKNVIIKKEDILTLEKLDADIVYIYMFNDFNVKVEPLLKKLLKKGTVVYSYAFTFPNLELMKVIPVEKAFHKKINVYKI